MMRKAIIFIATVGLVAACNVNERTKVQKPSSAKPNGATESQFPEAQTPDASNSQPVAVPPQGTLTESLTPGKPGTPETTLAGGGNPPATTQGSLGTDSMQTTPETSTTPSAPAGGSTPPTESSEKPENALPYESATKIKERVVDINVLEMTGAEFKNEIGELAAKKLVRNGSKSAVSSSPSQCALKLNYFDQKCLSVQIQVNDGPIKYDSTPTWGKFSLCLPQDSNQKYKMIPSSNAKMSVEDLVVNDRNQRFLIRYEVKKDVGNNKKSLRPFQIIAEVNEATGLESIECNVVAPENVQTASK